MPDRGKIPGDAAVALLCRLILWLYPRRTRRAHGEELVEVVQCEWRRRMKEGGLRESPSFFAWLLVDLVRSPNGYKLSRHDSHKRPCRPPRSGNTAISRFGTWIRDLANDIRYGLRGLRKTPAFTAAALISLAVGIGANTAIFSVVNGVLLQPLPYRAAEELHFVYVDWADFDGRLSAADYLRILELQKDPATFAACRPDGVTMTTPDGSEMVQAAWVTSATFDVLDISPVRGRRFIPDDAFAVIVGFEFWATHLSSTEDVLEGSLELDGDVYSIVGVLPPGFQLAWATETEIYPLFRIEEPTRRGPYYLPGIVRLRAGVTREMYQEHLQTVAEHTKSLYSEGTDEWRYGIRPMKEIIVGDTERMLTIMLVAVGCVLLIAVVNVANLLLARGSARLTEAALRSALGASKNRLVRQMVTESALLGLIGAILGIGLAWVGVEVLGNAAASFLPRMEEVSIDRWVLGFALAVGLLSGTIVGVIPVFSVPWKRLNQRLSAGHRGAAMGTRRGSMRKTLVVAEFALALSVLLASSLLTKSFVRMQSAELGFDDDGVVAFRLALPSDPYENPEEFDAFFSTLGQRLVTLPGLSDFGYATALPPDRLPMTDWYAVEGQEPESGETQPICPWIWANESFFQTLDIPLLQGRSFDDTDRNGQPQVAIVSEEFVRFHHLGNNAVGTRLKPGPWDAGAPWLTIVGVVGDVPYTGIESGTPRTVYRPYRQQSGRWREMWVATRLGGHEEVLVPQIRQEIAALDSRTPMFEIATMRQVVRQSTSAGRSLSVLFSVFSVIALLLAATGIYGVISYHVSTQRRDFAVRRALGAGGTGVVGMVLKEGMALVVVGIVIGCGGAYLLARGLASMLYEISHTDIVTYVEAVAALTVIALLACLIPSFRASHVDPVTALREE